MKMKQITLFILSIIVVGITACDLDGKKDHMKQQNNTITEQTDIILGNIGSKDIDTSLAGYSFKNETNAIIFNKDNAVCFIRDVIHGQLQPLSIGHESPVAEYTVKGTSITLNFTKFTTVMANRTIEGYEQYLRERLARMPNKPSHVEEEIKQMMEEVRKYNIIENVNKLYSEYQKVPPLEGELSADKKTITFKTFTIPGYDKIERYENVTFTQKDANSTKRSDPVPIRPGQTRVSRVRA